MEKAASHHSKVEHMGSPLQLLSVTHVMFILSYRDLATRKDTLIEPLQLTSQLYSYTATFNHIHSSPIPLAILLLSQQRKCAQVANTLSSAKLGLRAPAQSSHTYHLSQQVLPLL
jgi:hypothetical protein